MAANALEQSLLQAGGMLNGHPAQEKICKAFRAAVKRACRKGKKGKYPKKKFNDLFYEELNKIPGGNALIDELGREAPAILQGGQVIAYGGEMVGAANPAAMSVLNSVTMAGQETMSFTGSWGATGWRMLTAFWARRGAGTNIRFLDGRLSDGTVLELKGPGDKFHGNQAKDLVEVNGGNQPATAACVSCKAKCNNDGGGRARGCT